MTRVSPQGRRLVRRLRALTPLVAACAAVLLCLAPGVASAEGTTVTPAGAGFNVALVSRTNATFETPLGIVTCTESTTTGSVPATPGNADTTESAAAYLSFAKASFRGCSFPGASSVTIANNTSTGWSLSAFGYEGEENDEVVLAIAEEALRITIANAHGTCTIITPSDSAGVVGRWTDGSGGAASVATLGGQLTYTASGTCIAHCARLAESGDLNASFTYNVTNVAERGESITF
jgi:hypothetical protein